MGDNPKGTRRRSIALWLTLVVLLALAATGCGDDDSGDPAPTTAAPATTVADTTAPDEPATTEPPATTTTEPPEPTTTEPQELVAVQLALGWVPQWNFAGYLVADALGFYEEEGLDVEILPGGPGIQQIPLVGAERVEFATLGPDDVWRARVQDIPITNLLTIFQRAAYVYMVHADSGIEAPTDFAGRTVEVFQGEFETNYTALAAAVGLDRADVNEVPGTFDLAAFLTGDTDVKPVFVNDQPFSARDQGADILLISGADYGIPSIGTGLATSDAMIEENPEVVQAFVNGTMRGWLWAIENVDDSIDIVLAANDQLRPDHVAYEAESSLILITDDGAYGGEDIGTPLQERWDALMDLELELEVLPERVPFDEAVDISFIQNFWAEYGG